MITFTTGNLFDAKVDALVNPVNTVGVMGKGLALQFKKTFPANTRAYEAACKKGEVRIGEMFVFDAGEGKAPRYIVNFPTKEHWRSPSKLVYVEKGLVALVELVKSRTLRSLAVPALAAGLGGLAWTDVKPLVERALSPLDEVDVRVFEPMG